MDGLAARRNWLIWGAVVPAVLWAIVRTLGVDGGFPLIPLLAYTPYAAAAALLVTGLAVALSNWAASLLAAAATALLLVAVVPRALGGDEERPAGSEELRVLSANIHHGTADPAALVALVDRLDPDVLCVQELTPGFAARLRSNGIGSRLPRALITVRPGASGGGIYTRLPIRRLPSPPPVPFRMPRAMLQLPEGALVRLVDVHPYPPTLSHVGLWRVGLEQLPTADPSGPPWLLVGDFNATLDVPGLRDLLDSGYRDAADVTGRGLIATWPQGALLPPPVTIDHVLAARRVAILGYSVEDQPGSDHRAIFARLAVP